MYKEKVIIQRAIKKKGSGLRADLAKANFISPPHEITLLARKKQEF